ncbi:TPA: toxin-antitoxin system toxin subunit [Escherichia coli]|nr:toxin-antitoxin system toxin subunit [Escherichia coli]
MVTWNVKDGDLVVLPEYRSDPGLVVLNKTYNDLERPILVKYLDGTIIEPRFFDKIELKARNVRVKPFRAYVENHWRKLFAGLNGMFGVWL